MNREIWRRKERRRERIVVQFPSNLWKSFAHKVLFEIPCEIIPVDVRIFRYFAEQLLMPSEYLFP